MQTGLIGLPGLGKRSNNSRRVLAGDLDEHREAGIALDEGGNVRVVRSGKKVSFPMPRHGAILNLGGPLADGDLLTGANDTHIATLVERNTRFTMLVKIPRKDTTTVVAALAKHIGKLPEELRRSLTWDQGKEMHAHKRFTVATNVQVYFCDPRSPWQRGSNENTNGLLRQYFPRGTDFSRVSQSYLNAIALRLNQRPRKTLGFQTPADRLQAVLH